MSELLSSVSGGGGIFVANSVNVGQIPVSSSGDILVIPSVPGKINLLSYLIADTGPESGITITCGSRVVVSSLDLEDGSAAPTTLSSSFVIGPNTSGASNVQYIASLPGEEIKITKDTGSTGTTIEYCYQVSYN